MGKFGLSGLAALGRIFVPICAGDLDFVGLLNVQGIADEMTYWFSTGF